MIELKNVTKKYGNFKAVDNISFKIEKGEVVGFLGQNGAGKTTTMKMITGLIEPTNGEIFIEGEKISRKSRKCIGYMPENTPLYQELTVKEFIDYMAELKGLKRQERKQQVKKLITDLGLADVENKLIRNISRGYKQRVSLSGALIGNPDILILDEPTVGLDPKQVIEIRNLIKSLRKNHTVFISSHILSEISQMCQKVIIINKGKVVAIDTPNNLENKIARNSIVINIEDPNENIEKIKEKIPEIIEIKFINKLEKDIKQYEIFVKENADIRKKLFEILPQENISILELKNSEVGLEEAFIKLIESEGGNKDVGNS
ncbi:MAG TPA: ABC transporter ATP-binding protein [Clostridiaceae bacterium]|nr:ABC transporter ATP-binding protein [Clostridiaceae bacterium]